MAAELTITDSTEADMQTARGSRNRSSEMEQLLKAVRDLKPKQVRAIVIPKNLSAVKLRTKLSRAAQILKVKLTTVAGKDDKLYFRLKEGPSDS